MNIDFLLQDYNASTNDDLQSKLYPMSNFQEVIEEYGFSDGEKVDILDDTFDVTQDFFWFGQDGYIYSGTEEDIRAIIGGNTEQIKNTNTFYRYVIHFKGRDIGFLRAIDILKKEKVIPYSSEIDLLSISLFSKMHVPSQRIVKGKYCYFSEKGKIKFFFAIQRIKELYLQYGIDIIELKKKLKDYQMIDEFQCVA